MEHKAPFSTAGWDLPLNSTADIKIFNKIYMYCVLKIISTLRLVVFSAFSECQLTWNKINFSIFSTFFTEHQHHLRGMKKKRHCSATLFYNKKRIQTLGPCTGQDFYPTAARPRHNLVPFPSRLGLYNVNIPKIMTHSHQFWEAEFRSHPVQGPNRLVHIVDSFLQLYQICL